MWCQDNLYIKYASINEDVTRNDQINSNLKVKFPFPGFWILNRVQGYPYGQKFKVCEEGTIFHF